jgi:2',3'-cyclic-nucleotide 2'-phosphodiesterase (5'-nucleotidase family)
LPPDHEVAEVPIFQAFENGRYLGRIDFLVEPGDPKAELLFSEYVSVTADIPPDPEIDAIVTPYAESLKGHFKKVIGEAVSFLDGERERVRHEETALGNFVTDIMREYTGADIALINAGALRASIDIGPVRIEDIFKAVPYSDEIKLVTLSGADLLKVLSRSVQAQREAEDGGFLQVSGMFFDIRDDDAVNVSVGKKDRPLDPEASYTVAIPDFLATGGDGYALFIDKDKVNTRLPLRELIVETVKERGVISAQKEGRINRIR